MGTLGVIAMGLGVEPCYGVWSNRLWENSLPHISQMPPETPFQHQNGGSPPKPNLFCVSLSSYLN